MSVSLHSARTALLFALNRRQVLATGAIQRANANLQPEMEVDGGIVLIQGLFTSLFISELCIRWAAEGLKDFWMSNDVGWNLLDLLCCVIGLLDVSVELVIRNTGRLDEGNPLRGVTVVRVLRIVRIVRVVRVIRIMKFFKELRMMIFSTLNSLQSVVWIFFFLFVLFYMLLVSLIFKQLIQPGVGPGSSSVIERSSFLDYFYAHKPQTINCKILQRHADPLSIPDHSILCLCWLIHCFRQSQVCYYFSGLFTIY